MKEKYKVIVWCPYCLDEDDQGCFGGRTELLDNEFKTKEEAEDFGEEYTKEGICKFRVHKVIV